MHIAQTSNIGNSREKLSQILNKLGIKAKLSASLTVPTDGHYMVNFVDGQLRVKDQLVTMAFPGMTMSMVLVLRKGDKLWGPRVIQIHQL